jgi:hypothetical protein
MNTPYPDLEDIEKQARRLHGFADIKAPDVIVPALCLMIDALRKINDNLYEIDQTLIIISNAINSGK